MKNLLFFKLALLAALYLSLTASDCGGYGGTGGGIDPPNPTAADLVGAWVSYYFEQNGYEATDQYQMTLAFDHDGTCVQTLTKPPGITLTSTPLPYSMNSEGNRLTIGSAVLAIEKFDLGYELILEYQSGSQPQGFVQPWTAKFFRQ